MKKVLVPIVTAGVCVGVLLTAGTPPAIGTTGPTITPVTGGMNSPRGIAFDARGSMYVSESGAAGAGEAGLTQTGKVSKFAWGSPTPAWTRTFTSFYATQPGASSADVLGPEGISALGNGCLKRDSEHGRWRHRRHGNDCQVTMIMSESTPGILKESNGALADPQAGRLFRLDSATGAIRTTVDVGSQMYDWTGDHVDVFPSDFPDSNPYAVLVTRQHSDDAPRTFVADAGANTINEITHNGHARIVSYIPNETGPRSVTPRRRASPKARTATCMWEHCTSSRTCSHLEQAGCPMCGG